MTSTTFQPTYPVRLTGELDPNLSRWLWLVKMFLAIPHYVVLAFLLVAFAVTTVIAGFAIAFTGRYPRSLFAFNVGVLRWNWRVGFYVYAALGTDRYPPFTLARTDYPAEFDVAYPEHLSRGLVLVKWLMAVPHLLVVGLIIADLLPYPWTSHDWSAGFQPIGGFSVLNLLVVVAGFFLLITRQYPRGLFDLLVGISRWLYRVIAYVAFMSDEYPPFRLDQGPYESGAIRFIPPCRRGRRLVRPARRIRCPGAVIPVGTALHRRGVRRRCRDRPGTRRRRRWPGRGS